MPLMVMSPNIQELDSPSRKRNHEEYSESEMPSKPDVAATAGTMGLMVERLETTQLSSEIGTSPPPQSSPVGLTEAGSSQPNDDSTAPNTPSRQPLQPVPQQSAHNTSTMGQPSSEAKQTTKTPAPPAKKRKLTPAQKEAKEEEAAAKKLELEKKKEEAEKKKELKRIEKEKADKAKEEKKKESERKAREKQEEAEKKARAQPKIANFFAKKEPAAAVKTEPDVKDVAMKARSPSPPRTTVKTEYEKLAVPFFVHQHVSLAKSVFSMDDQTREAKSAILDEHLSGKRSPFATNPFDPINTLQLASAPRPRGRLYPSVKDLVSEQYDLMSLTLEQSAEVQKQRAEKTRKALKGIRMKQLSFHEDVRPGYFGTITSIQSLANLRKLAKNPIAKDLPLNYDYDSEAEWVQGDEEPDDEGEDLDDEEEDEEGDDKSIDEFLDDSEDVARVRGPYTMGNMEPEISGICFEDSQRQNPDAEMRKYRMELMIPNFDLDGSIDPFSTAYWPSEPKLTTAATTTSKAANNKVTKALGMAPPPTPSSAVTAVPTKAVSAADLVPAAQLEDFKATIVEFKFLPKAALIPTLKKKFDKCTAVQIKTTLDHVAEKPSKKGDWQIKGAV